MAAQAGNILAQHGHLTGGGQLLAQNQLEQGGFARAGVAQQKHELAFIHMEVDILQCQAAALFIFFGNVFKIDHGIVLAPDIKIFEVKTACLLTLQKEPASIGFERPVLPAAKPAQQIISIWPGCWTGTS